jgi:glycosyltransferase involved in cell wall biosynthesis
LILVHVTTVPETLGFMRGQIGYMKQRGFEVHAVSSPGKLLEEAGVREGIPVYAVDMPRRITPHRDLVALFKLFLLFRRLRPDIVHAHTPKGGLLGVSAARLARVPVVIYGMHGLPFVTARGVKRKLLCWSENLASRFAHRVITVSFSIRQQAVASGFCGETKIHVLGSGSTNGVDALDRFNPLKRAPGAQEEIRRSHGIPVESPVVGYVGRIVRDKGIGELADAWQDLSQEFPSLHLILVGPLEPQDPVPPRVLERLESDPRVHFIGSVAEPGPYYAAMDILALPTYREGFPVTPLEAAAMQLPVVATRVDGCTEAVVDGVTGLLVPPFDSQALAEAMRRLLLNPKMREQLGQAGRQRVLRDFKPEQVWEKLYQEYMEMLKVKKIVYSIK